MKDNNTQKTSSDYDDMFNKVIGSYDITNYQKLAGVIVKLEAQAVNERRKRIIVESGMQKLFEDIEHYQRKVVYREGQVRKILRANKKILNHAFSVSKKLKDKHRRNSSIKYLRRMKKAFRLWDFFEI